jgi:hypothetical protein
MYGILASTTNTGLATELVTRFTVPLTIRSNKPGYVGDTVNLKRTANSTEVQRWELEVETEQTNDDTGMFVHNVSNSFDNIVYIRMPQIYLHSHGKYGVSARTPVGAPLGLTPALALSVNAAAGSTLLSISGLGSFNLKAGEFITFEDDPKVYMIVNPGINGLNFTVFPSLRKAHVIGDEMKYGDKVTLQAFYDDTKIFGITYEDGVLTSPGKFTFIEAL